MSYEFTEEGFVAWLINDKCLSKKAARDVLSRLKRSQKLLPTAEFAIPRQYEIELNKILETSEIPETSQKSMLRAVRLFYDFMI